LAEVLFVSQSDPAIVHSLLEESLALSRELGDKVSIVSYFSLSGQLTLSQGDATTARTLAEKGLVLSREIGYRWGIAESLSLLAKAAAVEGDYAAARALSEKSLVISREVGDNVLIASSLEGLAGVATAQEKPMWAAQLWGAAEFLRETIDAPLPPIEQASYEQSITTARTQLGEKAFATAWAKGRTMTPEQALAVQEPAPVPEEHALGPAPIPLAKVPAYPAGLTAREVEVLRLVAQGLTDAQVAELLVISPRTVNWHLTSIYSKIQVSSRSAATRYAIEQHVV